MLSAKISLEKGQSQSQEKYHRINFIELRILVEKSHKMQIHFSLGIVNYCQIYFNRMFILLKMFV